MNDLKETVKNLRKSHLFTQQKMADAIGLTQANYSRMEHNNKFTLKALYKIAEALNMKLEITFTEKL